MKHPFYVLLFILDLIAVFLLGYNIGLNNQPCDKPWIEFNENEAVGLFDNENGLFFVYHDSGKIQVYIAE